jgi:hypothetical protein
MSHVNHHLKIGASGPHIGCSGTRPRASTVVRLVVGPGGPLNSMRGGDEVNRIGFIPLVLDSRQARLSIQILGSKSLARTSERTNGAEE